METHHSPGKEKHQQARNFSTRSDQQEQGGRWGQKVQLKVACKKSNDRPVHIHSEDRSRDEEW